MFLNEVVKCNRKVNLVDRCFNPGTSLCKNSSKKPYFECFCKKGYIGDFCEKCKVRVTNQFDRYSTDREPRSSSVESVVDRQLCQTFQAVGG